MTLYSSCDAKHAMVPGLQLRFRGLLRPFLETVMQPCDRVRTWRQSIKRLLPTDRLIPNDEQYHILPCKSYISICL
jgi:hypothetical protein